MGSFSSATGSRRGTQLASSSPRTPSPSRSGLSEAVELGSRRKLGPGADPGGAGGRGGGGRDAAAGAAAAAEGRGPGAVREGRRGPRLPLQGPRPRLQDIQGPGGYGPCSRFPARAWIGEGPLQRTSREHSSWATPSWRSTGRMWKARTTTRFPNNSSLHLNALKQALMGGGERAAGGGGRCDAGGAALRPDGAVPAHGRLPPPPPLRIRHRAPQRGSHMGRELHLISLSSRLDVIARQLNQR